MLTGRPINLPQSKSLPYVLNNNLSSKIRVFSHLSPPPPPQLGSAVLNSDSISDLDTTVFRSLIEKKRKFVCIIQQHYSLQQKVRNLWPSPTRQPLKNCLLNGCFMKKCQGRFNGRFACVIRQFENIRVCHPIFRTSLIISRRLHFGQS